MAEKLEGLNADPAVAGKTLSVITAIHGTRSAIQSLNNMTFLYDPSWVGDSSTITYPFCVFHVVSAKEIQESEVSTKRVIVYDGGIKNPRASEYLKKSMVDVISDNVVTRPKVYELQVYIPFDFISKGFSDTVNAIEAINFFIALYGEGIDPGFKAFLEGSIEVFKSTGRVVEGLARLLTGFNQDKLFGKAEVTDTNKDSLFAMMQNRSLLKLKTWDNWEYKNVVITNISLDKDGKMDDYYTGTIRLQELPVLSLSNSIGQSLENNQARRRWSLQAKKSFDKIVGTLSGGGRDSLS